MSEKPSVAFPNGFLVELDAHAKSAGLSRSAFIVKACNRAMGKMDDWRPNRSPVATTATTPPEPSPPLPAPIDWRAPCATCGKPMHQHSLKTGACPA